MADGLPDVHSRRAGEGGSAAVRRCSRSFDAPRFQSLPSALLRTRNGEVGAFGSGISSGVSNQRGFGTPRHEKFAERSLAGSREGSPQPFSQRVSTVPTFITLVMTACRTLSPARRHAATRFRQRGAVQPFTNLPPDQRIKLSPKVGGVA
jgi:hypothetical protein